MGSRTSHKPADPNQHTTGQNRACSRSMKGCNIISGFFFYFLHSFIWNNCSRRQNIFYYVGNIVPEGSTIFYYIGIIIQAEYFFIMLEQFSSFKKISVLKNNFNKKTHPNILKWDLVLKISP